MSLYEEEYKTRVGERREKLLEIAKSVNPITDAW
jgi:hypothetical protein